MILHDWNLEKKRHLVRLAYEALPPGGAFIAIENLIDDERRKKLRIPTDRRWGDRMVAAKAGVLFWPDYFHVKDSTIKGMHGYLDKKDETHGMMVLTGSPGRITPGETGLRPLVDVFPTLCNLLGLPVPKTQEGTSLISNGHAPEATVTVTTPVSPRRLQP